MEITVKDLDFKVKPMNAYASLKILGNLGSVLGPVLKNVDVDELENNPLSLLGSLDKVNLDLFMQTLQDILSKATFEGVPVDLKNVMWNKKLDVLMELAMRIVKEEYSDFLLSLGVDLEAMMNSQEKEVKGKVKGKNTSPKK